MTGVPTLASFPITLLLLFCWLGQTVNGKTIHDVVQTQIGMIQGKEEDWNGKKFTSFVGVPYGQPPVGNKRFAPPEMIASWDGVFEATSLATTCFFTRDNVFPGFEGAEMWNSPKDKEQSESCLNMNIWVPIGHNGTVLVWMFGGGFYSGSPSLDLYDGRVLAVRHSAIVVNINYRLGPFGFLYLGEESEVTGNIGLLDQQLALKWINQNIFAFGGDATRLTLIGESAGAASVSSHLFAPKSVKYFQRIIAMSGTIMNPWATRTKKELIKSSMELVKNVNCVRSAAKDILNCLRQVPTQTIQNAADEINLNLSSIHPLSFAFVPVEEDPLFFQGSVFEKIEKGDIKRDVSVLLGTVKDEGTYWLPYYLSDDKYGFKFDPSVPSDDPRNYALINQAQYNESIRAFLGYFRNSSTVMTNLVSAYLNVSENKDERERLRDGVAQLIGDQFFVCDIIRFADVLVETIKGNVYLYQFTQRSSWNPWPSWMGVMHGYEIEYIFGEPLRNPQKYKKETLDVEQTFSRKIMQLWNYFAVSGNLPCPRYDSKGRKSIEFGDGTINETCTITFDLHGDTCRLLAKQKNVA